MNDKKKINFLCKRIVALERLIRCGAKGQPAPGAVDKELLKTDNWREMLKDEKNGKE